MKKVKDALGRLAQELIEGLTGAHGTEVREGVVMSQRGDVGYRRLDCDGCALAYVRVRPRKQAVRVDISNLWLAPEGAAMERTSSGTCLMLRSSSDVQDAVRVLQDVVHRTRLANARRLASMERRKARLASA